MEKKSKAKTGKLKIAKVDNSVNPTAEERYKAVCDHTTIKIVDGNAESVTIKKNDFVTAKEVPQVWINQALVQKFLIREEDMKKWSNDDLKKNGYGSLAK